MTRHQKRLAAPTSWPVERKTNVFTVKAGAGPHGADGVPLLVLLRDVLGYVENAREADYALNEGTVLVNGKMVSDARRPIGMFDILVFTERGEYYRIFPDEGGRLSLTPIDADAADSKLGKIIGKRQVTGGQTQLTLHDGATVAVDDLTTYSGGDSVIVDNETGDIVAHFPYEEGALVTAVDGQHAGEIGEIDDISVTRGSGPNIVRVSTENGGFETIEAYVVVIDENFTAGAAEPEPAPAVEPEPTESEPAEPPSVEPDESASAESAEPAADEPAEPIAEEEPPADDLGAEDDEAEPEPAAEAIGPADIEDIRGVGPAKADALREAGFDTVEAIRAATPEELAEVNGIGEALASQIKDALDEGDTA